MKINKHCSKCGEKLIFKKRYIWEYDSNNGKPIYAERWECPNKRNEFIEMITDQAHRSDDFVDWKY